MIVECMYKLALGDLIGGDNADKLAGLGGAVGGVGLLLYRHFADQTQHLPKALHRSNQRAWRTLELALAGDGWLTRLKNLLARGEDRAIAEQIRAFLEANALEELKQHPAEVRQRCLEDLHKARSARELDAAEVDAQKLAEAANSWPKLTDPHERLRHDLQAVGGMANYLRQKGYPHLGGLLELQVSQGRSLLVTAVRYYFRREVESDRALFQGLVFCQVEQLDEKQARGFAGLNQVLAKQDDRLEELLKHSAQTLATAQGAKTAAEAAQTAARDAAATGRAAKEAAQAGYVAAKAGHEAVLDLREEMKQLIAGQDQKHQAQYEQFFKPVLQMLEKLQLQNRPVQATDSMSIRTDRDRLEAEQLVKHYRNLSPEQRRRFPALLNGLGQLEFAVNDFENAQQMFAEVATIAPSDRARALAHYNGFRAALERRRFDDALTALRQAATLDPAQFTPFPLHRYEPKRILGAGGFGAVFLCHDRNFAADVVVKVLHGADLNQGVESLFREARLLKSLLHPNIIGIHDCEYADPGHRARPYLVMDYFPGLTLDQQVELHGPLKLPDFLAVAKPVAEALWAAHRRNVLHRDIKPANLLVRKEGSAWQVRVIDFGLAVRPSVLSSASTSSNRQGRTLASTSIAGTIDYAAPEQLGKLPGVQAGPAADVYGFAKTACFALLRTTEPTLEDWDHLPKPLAQLLSRCMARTPEKRPQDFQEVLKGLRELTAKLTPTAVPLAAPIPVISVPPLPAVVLEPRLPLAGLPSVKPVEFPPVQSPPPLPEHAELIDEVLPIRPVGAVPVPLPEERPLTVRPVGELLLVRLFGNGANPSWLERMSKKPRKIKLYLDGDFVGEGDDWKGVDLRVHTAPGKHVVLLKALENVSATVWKEQLQEVSKVFPLDFAAGGKYTVRFDYLERGKLEVVTADVIRARG